jgi:predicted amidohydrolase
VCEYALSGRIAGGLIRREGGGTVKTLIVALWSVDTQGMQQAPLHQRAFVLKRCVERAYQLALTRLGRQGLDLNDKPLGLFAAPEYFVAHPDPSGSHDPGSRRHIDEADKELYLQWFKDVSATCKGMIMVPGTIAWRKPFERHGEKHISSKTGLWKPTSRYDKAIASVQGYAERQGLPVTSALSGSLWQPVGPPVAAPTTKQKLDALGLAQTLAPLNRIVGYNLADLEYLARNTAYVLLDGQVLLKYNKQGDFHEVLDGTKTLHIPGKLDGRFHVRPSNPSYRAISFGIEICLDHAFQTTGKEIPHLGKVDVHIITSAQLPDRKASYAVTKHGYLVHACSNSDFTTVKTLGRLWGKNTEKPFATEDCGGFPLSLWEIELDLESKLTSF